MPNYHCTESKAAPVLDVVMASLQLAGSVVALGSSNPKTRAASGFGIAFSGAFALSARDGFRSTDECAELKGDAQADEPTRSIAPHPASHGFMAPPPGEPPRAPQPPPGPFDRPIPPQSPVPGTTPDAGPLPIAPPAVRAPAVPQRMDDE
jgi:hypothetical protein